MVGAIHPTLNLSEFLQLPETQPASEYINGRMIQKPMPKGKHSRLQLTLCNQINQRVEASQIAYAFPELRCSFGTRSLVPDIAVFQWSRIPFEPDGEVPNDFFLPPDWMIEILSPEQSSNRVTGNILYCLEQGGRLAWLLDPADRSILVFQPQQQPILCQGCDRLSVLPEINLDLTVEQIFAPLKMSTPSTPANR
ncbi:Uma2 family endonuclease [Spirulina subsalsa]|uniref:Uma2 family endonuclease n=1 Tax=Spirulina subsalsa TaxID=54311 RepID=UPI00030143BA|nr:Uma2 family endonuclease [Spirulina subsalsa]